MSLLLGSNLASAQESDELLPLPPLDETFPVESVEEESESEIWMPSIFRETTGSVLDFFREGTFVSDGEVMFLNASPDPNDDMILAAELQFGWENPNGWGMRSEYFWFTQEWSLHRIGGGVGTPITGNPWVHYPNYIGSALEDRDVDNVHLDGYRRFSTGTTELVFGGGISFISYDQKFMHAYETGAQGGDYAFDIAREFMSGVGSSVMGEFRRPLIVRDSWEVAALGNGRSAIVPGELEVRSDFRRKTARCERVGLRGPHAWGLLRYGSWVSRLCAPLSTPPSQGVLRHPSQEELCFSASLLPRGRQSVRRTMRPDGCSGNVHYSSQGYPEPLRRIRYYDQSCGKRLVFLTNDFDLPATTIAALYKSRWQIEVYQADCTSSVLLYQVAA